MGTTRSITRQSQNITVHPHGRGDNAKSLNRYIALSGSPPRAWGQRSCSAARSDRKSGSPPRAWGQRSSRYRSSKKRSVHPHGRGDNALTPLLPPRPFRFTPTGVGTTRSFSRIDWQRGGSPPRAWGQRASCSQHNTFPLVHPHGRGDNGKDCPLSSLPHGSPPRAWGQRESPLNFH